MSNLKAQVSSSIIAYTTHFADQYDVLGTVKKLAEDTEVDPSVYGANIPHVFLPVTSYGKELGVSSLAVTHLDGLIFSVCSSQGLGSPKRSVKWWAKYPPGSTHTLHDHGPQFLSCVWMLSDNPDSNLVLCENISTAIQPGHFNETAIKQHRIASELNTLVIFKGNTPHYTTPSETDRYVYVANYELGQVT